MGSLPSVAPWLRRMDQLLDPVPARSTASAQLTFPYDDLDSIQNVG